MKNILLCLLLTAGTLLAKDSPEIPIQKTGENTILVGWRPREAGYAFLDSYGSAKTSTFGEEGDLAINQALKNNPNRKVLAIIPLLTPTNGSSAGCSSAVCGVWIILENIPR